MSENLLIVECPHCKCMAYIESIACQIFRHGAYKTNGEPIPPHSPKEICDKLVEDDLIYGCGLPFKLEPDQKGGWIAIVCDYI